MTQHSKHRDPPATRDSDERISLSDINELDADEIQAVASPSSAPPPPPKEALDHVVVPRLAPLKSDSLRPPSVPSAPPEDPETEIIETAPPRARTKKKDEEEADDRDVVDIRWVLAAAVLLAVVIGTWTLARRGEPGVVTPAAEPDRVALTLTGVPSGARVELDGRPVTGTEIPVRGGVRHAVEVHSEGHETWRQVFITRGQLELVVSLAPAAVAAPTAPTEAPPPEAAVTPPPAEAPPIEEPAAEAPPAREVTATRPRTTEPSTMTSTTATTSSTSGMTPATMRSTNTLVRDPGF